MKIYFIYQKIEHEFDSLPRTTFGTSLKIEKQKTRRTRKSKVKVEENDDTNTSNTTSLQTISSSNNSDDEYIPSNYINFNIFKIKNF